MVVLAVLLLCCVWLNVVAADGRGGRFVSVVDVVAIRNFGVAVAVAVAIAVVGGWLGIGAVRGCLRGCRGCPSTSRKCWCGRFGAVAGVVMVAVRAFPLSVSIVFLSVVLLCCRCCWCSGW